MRRTARGIQQLDSDREWQLVVCVHGHWLHKGIKCGAYNTRKPQCKDNTHRHMHTHTHTQTHTQSICMHAHAHTNTYRQLQIKYNHRRIQPYEQTEGQPGRNIHPPQPASIERDTPTTASIPRERHPPTTASILERHTPTPAYIPRDIHPPQPAS